MEQILEANTGIAHLTTAVVLYKVQLKQVYDSSSFVIKN
jgi:hypothetical protein